MARACDRHIAPRRNAMHALPCRSLRPRGFWPKSRPRSARRCSSGRRAGCGRGRWAKASSSAGLIVDEYDALEEEMNMRRTGLPGQVRIGTVTGPALGLGAPRPAPHRAGDRGHDPCGPLDRSDAGAGKPAVRLHRRASARRPRPAPSRTRSRPRREGGAAISPRAPAGRGRDLRAVGVAGTTNGSCRSAQRRSARRWKAPFLTPDAPCPRGSPTVVRFWWRWPCWPRNARSRRRRRRWPTC